LQNRLNDNEILALFEEKELRREHEELVSIKEELVRLLNIGCRVSKDEDWFYKKESDTISWVFNSQNHPEEKTQITGAFAKKVFYNFVVSNDLCSDDEALKIISNFKTTPNALIFDKLTKNLIDQLYSTIVLGFMLNGEANFKKAQTVTTFHLGSRDKASNLYGFFKNPIYDRNVTREILEWSGVLGLADTNLVR